MSSSTLSYAMSFLKGMCAAVVCVTLVLSFGSVGETGQGANTPKRDPALEQPEQRAEVIAKYRAISEKIIERVDVERVRNWVRQLDSDDNSKRSLAVDALRGEVGLDFGYDPAANEVRRQKASREWRVYADALDVAIKEKVPKLIEKRTERNKSHRALAAMHLGQSAPHPGFLQLLKEVIRNQEEDQNTRGKALIAVSQIPHGGMIEFLIKQLDTDLAHTAWHQLSMLTQSGIQNDTGSWPEVKRKYEEWWEKNKDEFVYERGRTLYQ